MKKNIYVLSFIFILIIISISIYYYYYNLKIKKTLNLSFIGDVMSHDVNYNIKPYSNIWDGCKYFFQNDDLSFANIEFTINPSLPRSSFPHFNNHPDYVEAAINAGIEVFSVANNHITDFGYQSILSTYKVMSYLEKERGIFYSGIKKNIYDPVEIKIINFSGWKIAYLSITILLNKKKDKEWVYYVDTKDNNIKNDFIEFINNNRNIADLFILSIHGGKEYIINPEPIKARFYKDLVAAGVDIIWGHHPHVLQPFEIYEENNRKGLIMYSTGNFISGQTWFIKSSDFNNERARTGESAIIQVSLTQENGKIHFKNISPHFIANYRDKKKGMIVKSFNDLTDIYFDREWSSFYKKRLVETEKALLINKVTSK